MENVCHYEMTKLNLWNKNNYDVFFNLTSFCTMFLSQYFIFGQSQIYDKSWWPSIG